MTARLISRRHALLGALACASCASRQGRRDWVSAAGGAPAIPSEVSGVRFPMGEVSRTALRVSLARYPPFLFNHCMRTFLFGAIGMEHHAQRYDADAAFVAAALHDLGLLPRYESRDGSFEVDGADEAARVVRAEGAPAGDAEVVWHAIALHDKPFAFSQHQGPESMLVAMGAGTDVVGPDPDMIDARRMQEVLAAFPRLGFKRQFGGLLVAHCKRKPLSQRGTWLEGFCREQVPQALSATLEEQIGSAPFAE